MHLRLSTSGVSLSKPPQPTPDAKGAGVPERKIGSEALAASEKLRKSSIECLSRASFEAARGEQLRLPAERPLKRRDGSSCGAPRAYARGFLRRRVRARSIPCQDWGSHLMEPHFSQKSLKILDFFNGESENAAKVLHYGKSASYSWPGRN